MENPSYLLAFFAGLLSFFSPCVLAVAPGYLTILTGTISTTEEEKIEEAPGRVIIAAFFFILGFTIIFILLGTAFSLFGLFLSDFRSVFLRIGGAILILLGLFQLGVFKFIPLNKDFRIHLKKPLTGPFGWIMTGATFAFGWTPCVGPVLSMILTMASTAGQIEIGVVLLFIYSTGLAIPFLLLALAFHKFYAWYRKILPYTWIVTLITGLLLIVVGMILFFDKFWVVSQWFNRLLGGWSLEEYFFH